MNNKPLSAAYPIGISREIESSLLSFCSITGLPVTYYDEKCQVRLEYGSQYKICKFLQVYNKEGSSCRQHLISAIRTAANLGEPYFFVCASGFVNIAIPLIQDGKNYGCFMAGPIIMEKFSHRTIAKLLSMNMISEPHTKESQHRSSDVTQPETEINHNADFLSRVISILREMNIYSSKQVAHLATLLNNSVVANLVDKSEYDKVNARYREQVQIGDDIRGLKRSGKETGYPVNPERNLIAQVRAGKATEAKEAMTAYLNGILLYEAGNLDFIKVHLIELCALISREGPDKNMGNEESIRDSFSYIESLKQIGSIQDLKEWSEDLVAHFTTRTGLLNYDGNSQLVLQVLRLIAKDNAYDLTLASAAAQLHVNTSYLSGHFKRETGLGFSTFINEQKINKSKDLLEKTNLRLLEIADLCGFEDQSYFTKVFSKRVGMSPREYRNTICKSLLSSDR
jgi:two-component system, response regulator YesN